MKSYQIKAARFQAYKDLTGFDFPSGEGNEALIRQLRPGELIEGAENVVLKATSLPLKGNSMKAGRSNL